MAKCRVAPLVGMTIPRGELQSLTMLTRMLLVVAETYPLRFDSVSTYTDSMCSLGALGRTTSTLKPYFANRVSEILQLRVRLSELTSDLAPVHHVEGVQNPADLGTRGTATMDDLLMGSRWQTGPDFLHDSYKEWPVTSAEERSQGAVPAEEVRKAGAGTAVFIDHKPVSKSVSMAATRSSCDKPADIARVMFDAIRMESRLGVAMHSIATSSLSREKLEVSVKSLARVLRAIVSGRRASCETCPGKHFIELAIQILLRVSSVSSRKALESDKLQGLGAIERGGVVWVQGRVRKEVLAELLGTTELPILMGSEPLAKSILNKSHRVDHRRSPQDIAARARRSAWIVGATRAAKEVSRKCYWCRRNDKKMAAQQMGGLPDERTTFLAPFEAVALDLFGPFKVRDPANGRREFKCWIVAFICLATKAACLLACPGYSTLVFIDTFKFFLGIYGQPRLVYTDHAPSLVKAAETHNWDEIAAAIGDLGTVWKLTAKGCSWRNGMAERLIHSARHTLAHELRQGIVLDFHQFSSTLSIVASILNSRPLSVRTTPDGDFMAIAPRDVLLGRAGKSQRRLDLEMKQLNCFEDDQRLDRVDTDQSRIVARWREKWISQVFPDLVPRQKWKQPHYNLQVGDIGLLKYEKKLGPDAWRLARITHAQPGSDGKVRTIRVAFRRSQRPRRR